jgi:hypothetical protein
MQLPYDRCVKIDQEVDTLLEEEKKKQQLNKRKAKLIEDSKKSRHFAIYKWLGWNLMLEYVCGKILEAILVVPLFLLYCTDENVCEKVIHIVVPSMTDLIRIKMLKNKYMIPTNVIDCPISVKQQLYNEINGSSKYLLTKHNGRLYVCDVSFSGKMLDIEHNEDVKYLLAQLVEGEYYSIADIITDSQVKYEEGN